MGQATAVSRRTIHSPLRRALQILARLLSYLLLSAGGIVMLFPFAWMASLSLGTMADLYAVPPRYIPEVFHWENYPNVTTIMPFFRYLRNTLVITAASMVGMFISCTSSAYAFARLRWKGRDLVFVCMLATMMMPPQVTLIPMYVIWHKLGTLDTYVPLIVPWYLGVAFLTFLARQFFATIPFELEDAARVDGCGFFSTYFRVMLPLSVPLLVTLGLFGFVRNWNNFFGPLIYLTTPDKYTLQLGMLAFRGQYYIHIPLTMAAATMILIPILVIFLFGQQYFIRSVVLSGLKG